MSYATMITVPILVLFIAFQFPRRIDRTIDSNKPRGDRMTAVEQSIDQAVQTSRDRPRLHIHPDRGWLNDPNGLCRIDGTYHVFHQHKDEPVHGKLHWGHASSPDLVRWTVEPVALHPQAGGPDRGGCWSGCIVDDDGVPTAVYTGVLDTSHHAGVTLSRSDRGLRHWTTEREWRVGTPEDPEISDVRDPFVFTFEGRRFAVQGAGHVLGSPQLLLYGCDDLENWTELGPLLTGDDPVAATVAAANIWECPNLFRLEESWVLLVSLWRSHQLSGVRYLLGDLVAEGSGLRFVSRSGGTFDSGPTFYAPQVLVEPDRVLLWGWAWEASDRSDEAIRAAGWSGTLTSPREVVQSDGGVTMRPAAELTSLRRESLSHTPGQPVEADAFEVLSDHRLTLRMKHSGDEQVVVQSEGPARLLIDGSLVECFGPTGAFTTRAYPGEHGEWYLDSDGPVTIWLLGLPD